LIFPTLDFSGRDNHTISLLGESNRIDNYGGARSNFSLPGGTATRAGPLLG
jgi:hypothetical protein